MLYLSNNNLIEIPGEVFSVLKYLEWLDVRNNQLSSLPASIKRHVRLQTILLQQNKVENLPLELCKHSLKEFVFLRYVLLKKYQVERNSLDYHILSYVNITIKYLVVDLTFSLIK